MAEKKREHIPHWRLILDQGVLTDRILAHSYPGTGTEQDPHVVNWIEDGEGDPRDPMQWPRCRKWFYTMMVALATLAVTLMSSAYSGGIPSILDEFDVSSEIGTLGLSLFVVGFAIGPLLWAPLSEMYGRQILFFLSYAGVTAFNAGVAGSQNIWTLLILRFIAGTIGSSPLSNAGGVIADMFPASERGRASTMFAAAPFLGPVLGPVIGGFLGMNAGWRWVMGFLAAFSGAKRAASLAKHTGKVYISVYQHDQGQGKKTLGQAFKTALSRPWILLFREPIVLLLSIYIAILYGTLYLCFGAFPIEFQRQRGWNLGLAGLPFLGVMVGMFGAIAYNLLDNKRYIRVQQRHGGFAPPEARLPPCFVGSVAIPISLFWFAWTTSPSSIHWIVPIIAIVPFGFGIVLVFLSVINYLVDSYTIYAASVLAANSVLRSLFGAAFPLFTTQMYDELGTRWASSIPAFLALACVPLPLLFIKYGPAIRKRCQYAAESDAFVRRMEQRAARKNDSVASAAERSEPKDTVTDVDVEAGP
ncbi:hypothetical protein BDW74DRAFT_179828 [Aspergillus multicolor]|uniref:MFS transporter n=1 Tax=Aspergillus multicolor TaxID=41759 RepID=UPI003CCD18A0